MADKTMEEGTQEQKLCDNCKKEVSLKNFVMHEAHCFRNIALCEVCDEPFPKADLEAHVRDAHAKIKCAKCGKEVEQQAVERHESESCAKRLVKCCYCDMEVMASEREEHEDYCGSRTEHCKGCGQYVMVKFLDIHNSNNHVFLTMEDLDKQYATNGIDDVASMYSSLKNFHSSKDDKEPLLLRSRVSPSKRTNDMPQINVDVNNERRKETNKPVLNEELAVRRSSPGLSEASKMSLEQLDRLLALHMTQSYARSEGDRGDPGDSFTSSSGRHTSVPETLLSDWGQAPTRGVLGGTGNDVERGSNHGVEGTPRIEAVEEMSLPCEFCNELFPCDLLLDHQSYCQLSSLGNSPQRHVDGGFSRRHESSALNNVRGSKNKKNEAATILNDFSTPAMIPNLAPNDMQDMIPCEYCGELFNSETIILHESGCNVVPAVGVEGLESATKVEEEDEELSALPAVPPFPTEDPMKWNSFAEEMRRQKYHWDPDADYLDDLFLKEAIENSLKDHKTVTPPTSDTENPSLANLSLRSPAVRHVPIKVSPEYGKQRQGRKMPSDENAAVNYVREAKALYANSGSPLVSKTLHEPRLTAEECMNRNTYPSGGTTTTTRHHLSNGVDTTGARPKKFIVRTAAEQPDGIGASQRDPPGGAADSVEDETRRSASLSTRNQTFVPPVQRETVLQEATTRPVAPRRLKTKATRY